MVKGSKVNRKFKDTVFRQLFQEKERLLQLYNAINNTHYKEADKLEIVTLENAIYMTVKNDLAFIVDLGLHMYEHQSTVNSNMPLRFLQYVAKEYEKLVDKNTIYRKKQIKLPAPHFVVFYNGSEEQPERQELYLSEAYEINEEDPKLELKVLVLNINPGKNKKLMEECQILKEYMKYVACVRKYVKQTDIEKAVEIAISECIKEGILEEFLRKNRAEAKKMSIFEYNEEEALKLIRQEERDEGWEEGRAQGRAEGELLKLVELVCKKLAKGKVEGEIAKELEENIECISTICNIAKEYAPDYKIKDICEKYKDR